MDLWHYPRLEFTQYILKGMKDGLLDRVTIFAPRKRGKTQFITKDIVPACEKMDILPIYIDFWRDKRSPESAFIVSVIEALNTKKPIYKRLLEGLKLTPQLSLSGLNLKAEAESKGDEYALLSQTFQLLNECKFPALLLLDEVQHLATDKEFEPFTAALRSFMTARSDNKVKGIFTGSSQEGLSKLFKRSQSAFYDSSQTLDFKPLDNSFVDFQLDVFTKVTGGNLLQRSEAYKIFKRQQFNPERFSNLIKRMALQNITDIKEGFNALDNEYLSVEYKEFHRVIGNLKPLDNTLLMLVAKGEGINMHTEDKKSQISKDLGQNVSSSLLGAAMRRLADKELIYSKDRGVWDISDPAMREFLLSPDTRF